MADPDELYTLRNRFWLGNFQAAIQEGNGLSRLSDDLKVERDEFVYRCYIGLGQCDLVAREIGDDAPPALRAVRELAKYVADPAGTKDAAIEAFGGLLTDPSSKNVASVQLCAALVYEKEDLMKEAFTAIRPQSTMEQLALWAQLCLKINRPDLAEAHLAKLQKADEDATLTQLVSAWVNMTKGGEARCKEAAYAYEELIDKFEPSLTLLNGLAVAKMHLRDFDEAEARLNEALAKSHSDADTLINCVSCAAFQGKDQQIIDRYLATLYSSHPNHPHVVKLKAKEAEFDELAAAYLKEVTNEEDLAKIAEFNAQLKK